MATVFAIDAPEAASESTNAIAPDGRPGPLAPVGGAKERAPRSIVWGLVKGLLSAWILAAIFLRVIPSFASYEDIGNTLGGVSTAWLVALLLVFVVNQVLKGAAPAIIVKGLGLLRAFVADLASGAVSRVIPGPSGTASRWVIYESWGFGTDDFARATVMNSIWSNGVVLIMPSIAIALVAFSGQVTGRAVVLSLIGLVVSAVAVVLLVLVMRSERFAYKLGDVCGRLASRVLRLFRRPPIEDFGVTLVGFRSDTVEVFFRVWLRLTIAVLARYVSQYFLLLFSLRAVGVGSDVLSPMIVFAGYAVARVATMIEITPGGIGVTEAIYIAVFSWLAGPAYEEQITAAVLLFRAFDYIGSLILGGFCYLIWLLADDWKADEWRERREADKAGRPRRSRRANPEPEQAI